MASGTFLCAFFAFLVLIEAKQIVNIGLLGTNETCFTLLNNVIHEENEKNSNVMYKITGIYTDAMSEEDVAREVCDMTSVNPTLLVLGEFNEKVWNVCNTMNILYVPKRIGIDGFNNPLLELINKKHRNSIHPKYYFISNENEDIQAAENSNFRNFVYKPNIDTYVLETNNFGEIRNFLKYIGNISTSNIFLTSLDAWKEDFKFVYELKYPPQIIEFFKLDVPSGISCNVNIDDLLYEYVIKTAVNKFNNVSEDMQVRELECLQDARNLTENANHNFYKYWMDINDDVKIKFGSFFKMDRYMKNGSNIEHISASTLRSTYFNVSQNIYVSSRLGRPYLMRANGNNYEGYIVDLLDKLSSMIGFTYKINLVGDNKYGQYLAQFDTWNGLIGDLLENKADMAIADLTITSERLQVVDFSIPFMTLGIGVLYKDHMQLTYLITKLVESNLCPILLIILTVMLALTYTVKWYNKKNKGVKPNRCLSCLEKLNYKIICVSWWISFLVIVCFYIVYIILMNATFKNIESLSKQDQIKYGTIKNGATYNFFKYSKNPVYEVMWQQMNEWDNLGYDVFMNSNQGGVVNVLNYEDYAFIMETTAISHAISENCKLAQIDGLINERYYGIAFPKDSSLKNIIDTGLTTLQTEGYLLELQKKWLMPDNCDGYFTSFLIFEITIGVLLLLSFTACFLGKKKIC